MRQLEGASAKQSKEAKRSETRIVPSEKLVSQIDTSGPGPNVDHPLLIVAVLYCKHLVIHETFQRIGTRRFEGFRSLKRALEGVCRRTFQYIVLIKYMP